MFYLAMERGFYDISSFNYSFTKIVIVFLSQVTEMVLVVVKTLQFLSELFIYKGSIKHGGCCGFCPPANVK